MNRISPESLVSRTYSIATLPDAYMRLNEAVNNPNSSFAEVAKVIREDVGLSSRLLKLVNSAFFGFPSKIDSISRACVIVGTMQLRSLALATSVIDSLSLHKSTPFSIEAFWKHSVGCAVSASVLARQRGETDVERFFVCGLLHDIGRIVLLNEIPEEYFNVIKTSVDSGHSLHEVEYDKMGFSHAEVGGALLKMWKLPSSLVDPVTWHHRPSGCSTYNQEARTLQIGDMVAHAMELGDSGSHIVPDVQGESLEAFVPLVEKMDLVLEQIDQQFSELSLMILGDRA